MLPSILLLWTLPIHSLISIWVQLIIIFKITKIFKCCIGAIKYDANNKMYVLSYNLPEIATILNPLLNAIITINYL